MDKNTDQPNTENKVFDPQDDEKEVLLPGKKILVPVSAYSKKENVEKTKSFAQIAAFLHLKNLDTKATYLESLPLVESILDTLDPQLVFENAFKKFFKHKETVKRYPGWVKVKNVKAFDSKGNKNALTDTIVEINLIKLQAQDPVLYNVLVKKPTEWIFFFKTKLYTIVKRRCRLIFAPDIPPNLESVKGIGYNTFDHLYHVKGVLKRLNKTETSESIANIWKCLYCPTETFITKQWHEKEKTVVCTGCGQSSTNNHYLYEKFNCRMLESWLPGVIQMQSDDEDEKLSPESKVFNLRFLSTDLVNPFKAGEKVEVVGILKNCTLGGQKEDFTYFDVLAVKKLDCDNNLKAEEISPERVQELKLLSKNRNFWDFCFETLYPDIHGLQDCKKAIVLQQFSQPEKKKDKGTPVYNFLERDTVHVLLVGDAGCGKSKLLHRSHQIFGGLKTCGYSSTTAGLTAGLFKDARGEWGVDVGLLILGNRKTVYMDELDKISKSEIMNSLLECMEQQEVSLAKVNTHGTYEAKTAILAAANPRYKSNFDLTEPLVGQIELPQVLTSRFDIIVPITQDLSYRNKIKMKSNVPVDTLKLMKDYILYSKTIGSVEIPEEIWQKVNELIAGVMRKIKELSTLKKEYKVLNPRTFPSLLRLLAAKARSRLSKIVSLEDFRFIRDFFLDLMVKLYGIQRPLFNTKDLMVDASGILISEKKIQVDEAKNISYDISDPKLEKAIYHIKSALNFSEMDSSDLIKYLKEKEPDLCENLIQKALSKLEKHGYVYKPDMKRYKLSN